MATVFVKVPVRQGKVCLQSRYDRKALHAASPIAHRTPHASMRPPRVTKLQVCVRTTVLVPVLYVLYSTGTVQYSTRTVCTLPSAALIRADYRDR
jgi:hypothetical protein